MTQPKGEGQDRSPPWQVEVDVHVYGEDCDPPFTIQSFLQSDKDGDLIFRNRGRHGFIIRYHLFDETGEGWEFPRPNDVAQALWSHDEEGCPPENCGQWREFTAERIEGNRKVLVVRNLNETETKFGYTLRVTKDDGACYRNLDPGGDNQNGNWN